MLASIVFASVIAIQPVSDFAARHAESRRLLSADGHRIVQASGFLFATGARRPEEAASAFLSQHGAAFGLTGREVLVLRAAPFPGEVGAVRFGRSIDGLPVFGGDLVVGVDAQGRVFLVNGTDVPAGTAGRFTIGEGGARAAALTSFGSGARAAGEAQVTAGWQPVGASLRAAYQVVLGTEQPAGLWRVAIDAESGALLFREDLRIRASGSVFDISPMEDTAGQCPLSGGAGSPHTACKSPVSSTLDNLTSATNLTGTYFTVYNCQGHNYPTTFGSTGLCTQSTTPNSGMPATDYVYPVDATNVSAADEFAAVTAYHQLEKQRAYLKSLDPSGGGGLTSNIPVFVNAYEGGQPLDNAFFGSNGVQKIVVIGQGTVADFAYDGSVHYHELTHGQVAAFGGFATGLDTLGGLDEPGAVNEGSADALATSNLGRSQIGLYVAGLGSFGSPAPYLRDMNDPNLVKTCQGDGTSVTEFGLAGVVNGLDGEVHDDGEIWNSFFWELHQGLAGSKWCGGSCDAAPAIQNKAIELAGGTQPTLQSYANTMAAAASALFPASPEISSYVSCVAGRHGMPSCNRTVKVYTGEIKLSFVRHRYGAFQLVVTTTGAANFTVCSARGTATTLWAKQGGPVILTSPSLGGPTTTNGASFVNFTRSCSGGVSTIGIPSAGTWYLLTDSQGAESPNFDIYLFDFSASGGSMAARPAPVTPATCTPPPPVISNAGGGGGGGGSSSSGCGCGQPDAGAGIAALVGLYAFIRRQSRARRGEGRPE